MKTEAEIEVMRPQAKENQGVSIVTRSLKRGLGWILPQSLQEEATLPTPLFQTSRLRMCEAINFFCKPPSLWYFVTAALGHQYRCPQWDGSEMCSKQSLRGSPKG